MPRFAVAATAKALLVLAGLCSLQVAGAVTPAMTRAEFVEARDTINTRHDKALAHCKTEGGAAQPRCKLQADGRRRIDLAVLEARYHPSANNSYKAVAADVEMRYTLAQDTCKTKHAGSDKEAKAALKECNDKAKTERFSGLRDAHQHAAGQASVATPPKSEAERQREADLDTAIRKCDSLLGDANLQCMRALSPEARQRAAERASGGPARKD
jgi:hypothetical protein